MASHPSGNSPSKAARAKKFLSKWIRSTWFDDLTMFAVSLVTVAIYYFPSTPWKPRKFPMIIEGNISTVPTDLAYDYQDPIIPPWGVALMVLLEPCCWYVLGQIFIWSARDACNAITGTTWAVLMANFFQVMLKQMVGGLRPYFLDVCMPDGHTAPTSNMTKGVGFGNIMYTIDVCTQEDTQKLNDAIRSFPSGHTTAAFAGYGFLLLWLNGKFKIWADHRPGLWKIILTCYPLVNISVICTSVLIGDAHHWYDIVAGAAIGIAMSLAMYRSMYAAVWDWRFNHLPLDKTKAFRYGADGDYDRGHTFSRAAGWGGRQKQTRNTVDTSTEDSTAVRVPGDQAV